MIESNYSTMGQDTANSLIQITNGHGDASGVDREIFQQIKKTGSVSFMCVVFKRRECPSNGDNCGSCVHARADHNAFQRATNHTHLIDSQSNAINIDGQVLLTQGESRGSNPSTIYSLIHSNAVIEFNFISRAEENVPY